MAARKAQTVLKIDNRYYLDHSKRFHRFEYRPYALSLFNIPSQIASFKEINRFVYPRCSNKYVYNFLRHFHLDKDVYDEVSLPSYNQLINIPSKDAYLTGYFQKFEYIENDVQEIERIFTFTDKLPKSHETISNIIKTESNAVCIVFRRGDYVNHPVLGIIELGYYYKAIEILKSKFSNLHFFIFSDDIPWCINNFKPKNCTITFVDAKYTGMFGGNYLQLMMLCSHFIIPNSTYPYWAALLSKHNPNKLVIAPKVWYRGQDPNTRNSILPPSWIAL